MARKALQGLRVAVLTADGFEQVEVTDPVDALEDAGAEVDVVSLRPGWIRGMNHMKQGRKVRVDVPLMDADAADYDALLIPGGLIGPDQLRMNGAALDFVRAFDYAGKPIAAICHGPWLLISAGLARGRRLTSWPAIRDDVRNAGGLWEDDSLVHDRNWISSRGPHDLPRFRRAIVDHFAAYAPAGVTTEWTEEVEFDEFEEEEGGLELAPLLASALALAAVGYGVNRLRTSMAHSRTTEEYTPAPAAPIRPVPPVAAMPAAAPVTPVAPVTHAPRTGTVTLMEEEVVIAAPREHPHTHHLGTDAGALPPRGYDATPQQGFDPNRSGPGYDPNR